MTGKNKCQLCEECICGGCRKFTYCANSYICTARLECMGFRIKLNIIKEGEEHA